MPKSVEQRIAVPLLSSLKISSKNIEYFQEIKKLGLEHSKVGLSKEPQGRTVLPRRACADCLRHSDRLRALYVPSLDLAHETWNKQHSWREATRKMSLNVESTYAQSLCAMPPLPCYTFSPVKFPLTGPPMQGVFSLQPSVRVPDGKPKKISAIFKGSVVVQES